MIVASVCNTEHVCGIIVSSFFPPIVQILKCQFFFSFGEGQFYAVNVGISFIMEHAANVLCDLCDNKYTAYNNGTYQKRVKEKDAASSKAKSTYRIMVWCDTWRTRPHEGERQSSFVWSLSKSPRTKVVAKIFTQKARVFYSAFSMRSEPFQSRNHHILNTHTHIHTTSDKKSVRGRAHVRAQ